MGPAVLYTTEVNSSTRLITLRQRVVFVSPERYVVSTNEMTSQQCLFHVCLGKKLHVCRTNTCIFENNGVIRCVSTVYTTADTAKLGAYTCVCECVCMRETVTKKQVDDYRGLSWVFPEFN